MIKWDSRKNDFLKGKYIVVDKNKLEYTVNLLKKFGYNKSGGISNFFLCGEDNEKNIIECESEELFIFNYDFYMSTFNDKIEMDINIILREKKLKRILKTKSLLK